MLLFSLQLTLFGCNMQITTFVRLVSKKLVLPSICYVSAYKPSLSAMLRYVGAFIYRHIVTSSKLCYESMS